MNVTLVNTMTQVNTMAQANTRASSTKSYSSTSDESFKSFVQNAANDKSNVQNNSTVKDGSKINSNDSYKDNSKNTSDNVESEDSKVESYLKQAGFSDDEIKNIKDEIKSGKIDEKDVISLLSLLCSNNKSNGVNLDDILNKIADNVSNKILSSIDGLKENPKNNLKDVLNMLSKSENNVKSDTDVLKDLVSMLSKSDDNTNVSKNDADALNELFGSKLKSISDILSKSDKGTNIAEKLSEKIADNIVSKITNGTTDKTNTDDLKSKIYNEILSKLNSNSEGNILSSNISSQKNNSDNGVQKTLIQSFDEKNLNLDNKIQNSKSEDNNNSTGNKSKDSDILSKIASGEKNDTKVSRVSNFMTQFNNITGDNTAVKGSSESLTLNKSTFSSDIIKSLKYMDLNNVKNLTVKINPKELGEITINLTMEGGKMKAALTASNKDAYNLLNLNLQDMSDKLQNNDIKVQGFSLNLYHEDTTFFKDESGKWNQNEHGKKNKNLSVSNIPEDEEMPVEDYYNDNNVNMLA